METEHAEKTAEKSGLAEPPILAVADASTTALLCVVQKRLEDEMESVSCNQTESAKRFVKAALEILEAWDKDRVSAAKR